MKLSDEQGLLTNIQASVLDLIGEQVRVKREVFKDLPEKELKDFAHKVVIGIPETAVYGRLVMEVEQLKEVHDEKI